jgi:hypothetical protein
MHVGEGGVPQAVGAAPAGQARVLGGAQPVTTGADGQLRAEPDRPAVGRGGGRTDVDLDAAGLDRPGRDQDVLQPEVLTREREWRVAGQAAQEDLEFLVHQRSEAGAIDAQAGELLRPVARADPDQDPAARQVVKEREVLGDVHRVAQPEQLHPRAKTGLGRARGQGAEGHGRTRAIAVVREMVLGDPEAGDAESVRERGERQLLLRELIRRAWPAWRVAEIEQYADARLGPLTLPHAAVPPRGPVRRTARAEQIRAGCRWAGRRRAGQLR